MPRQGISLAARGGYFGGMVRPAEKGQLYLEKTLWALRGEKMGQPGSRAVN